VYDDGLDSPSAGHRWFSSTADIGTRHPLWRSETDQVGSTQVDTQKS